MLLCGELEKTKEYTSDTNNLHTVSMSKPNLLANPERWELFQKHAKEGVPFKMVSSYKGDTNIVSCDVANMSIEQLPTKGRTTLIPMQNGTLVPISKFAKTSEFGGGGKRKRSAATDTALGEAYAGLCATAFSMNSSTTYTDEDLLAAYKKGDYSSNDKYAFKHIITASKSWKSSAQFSAAEINRIARGTKIVASHNSRIHSIIAKIFKEVNKNDKQFSDLNKWNPADIWMYSSTVGIEGIISIIKDLFYDGSKIKKGLSWDEFNKGIAYMAYANVDGYTPSCGLGVLFGISLKQTVSEVSSHSTYNFNVNSNGTKLPTFNMLEVTAGKTGFFNSMDTYAFYSDENGKEYSMQYRSFSASSISFQGEITLRGSAAKHGKIGKGTLDIACKNYMSEYKVYDQQRVAKSFAAGDMTTWEEFYKLYKRAMTSIKGTSNEVCTLDNESITIKSVETFKEACLRTPLALGNKGDIKNTDKQAIRLASKFLGLNIIMNMIEKPEDGLQSMSNIQAYASSSTPVSGPFYKVGG